MRGFASRLTFPSVRTQIPKNLVVIMKEVGREVSLLTHPVIFDLPATRLARMVRSMSRRIIRARTSINPSASMCLGDLRNKALTKTGSVKNAKLRSTMCWSL